LTPVRLLAIAGSDSGGGAGIQADIKTATALGAYAMTAVTAVTAQDTTGIGAVHLVPAVVVLEQIERCLADIGADAIKIGMLGSAEIAQTVSSAIARRAPSMPRVVDPVMVSTRGVPLADGAVADILKKFLFPGAALITPNLPEAESLCGFKIQSGDDLLRAGAMLISLGPQAVLIKGGHGGSDTVTDLLFMSGAEPRAYIAKRVDTPHTHGTGCTLSTAIACGLGKGLPPGDAVQRAHDFVQNAIRTAPGFGAGNGPIGHLKNPPSP
jgi:hydroxymethylpyrimidine/phosphomethylpyrimidine kinase